MVTTEVLKQAAKLRYEGKTKAPEQQPTKKGSTTTRSKVAK